MAAQNQEFKEEPQQQHSKPIIHVRSDSEDEMAKMFAVVNPNTNIPIGIPLRMRNLPPSFFEPPPVGSKSPGVHSRENSLDNGPLSPGPNSNPTPPPNHHARTNSCPATLGQMERGTAAQHQVIFKYKVKLYVSNLNPTIPFFWQHFWCLSINFCRNMIVIVKKVGNWSIIGRVGFDSASTTVLIICVKSSSCYVLMLDKDKISCMNYIKLKEHRQMFFFQ